MKYPRLIYYNCPPWLVRIVSWPLLLTAYLSLTVCDRPTNDPRFATPATTYRIYQQAVAGNDIEVAWDCLADSYRETRFEGDLKQWRERWSEHRILLQRDLDGREIIEEREINARIAYLLFDIDESLGSKPTPPYYYFLHQREGWRITSYLDSTFHQELEQAIENGEYSVPH